MPRRTFWIQGRLRPLRGFLPIAFRLARRALVAVAALAPVRHRHRSAGDLRRDDRRHTGRPSPAWNRLPDVEIIRLARTRTGITLAQLLRSPCIGRHHTARHQGSSIADPLSGQSANPQRIFQNHQRIETRRAPGHATMMSSQFQSGSSPPNSNARTSGVVIALACYQSTSTLEKDVEMWSRAA